MRYRDYNAFEKLRFQNGFRSHEMRAFSNSSGLKKAPFSVEIKVRFPHFASVV